MRPEPARLERSVGALGEGMSKNAFVELKNEEEPHAVGLRVGGASPCASGFKKLDSSSAAAVPSGAHNVRGDLTDASLLPRLLINLERTQSGQSQSLHGGVLHDAGVSLPPYPVPLRPFSNSLSQRDSSFRRRAVFTSGGLQP